VTTFLVQPRPLLERWFAASRSCDLPISPRRFQGFSRSGTELEAAKIVWQRRNKQARRKRQVHLSVRDALEIGLAAIADTSATLAAAGCNGMP
jgi:hypothetical protein